MEALRLLERNSERRMKSYKGKPMNLQPTTLNRTRSPLLFIAFIALLISGCKMEEKTWIDKMLSEMEVRWIQANEAGLKAEERDAAVSSVAQKYLRIGASEEEIFRLLHELSDHKFEIYESRHEGARAWPEKKILPWESAPYPDAATIGNLRLRYSQGASYFTIRKMYQREWVIIKKTIVISFKISDEDRVVSSVEATLIADSF